MLSVFSLVKGGLREINLSELKLPAVRLRRTTGNALTVAFSATFMPRFILPRLIFFHYLFWLIVPHVQFEIIGGPFFLATLLGIQVTFEFFGKYRKVIFVEVQFKSIALISRRL